MRYVWGLLASLLVSSPAQAASVDFAFDVIFNGETFLDIGRISIPEPAEGFTGLIEDFTSPFTFAIPGVTGATQPTLGSCQGVQPSDCNRSFFVDSGGGVRFLGFGGVSALFVSAA